jgi:hypothetical protein
MLGKFIYFKDCAVVRKGIYLSGHARKRRANAMHANPISLNVMRKVLKLVRVMPRSMARAIREAYAATGRHNSARESATCKYEAISRASEGSICSGREVGRKPSHAAGSRRPSIPAKAKINARPIWRKNREFDMYLLYQASK